MRPRLNHRHAILAATSLWLSSGAPSARAETDRDSPQQFLYEEHLRSDQRPSAERITSPHRASSTFRRILMYRGAGDQRIVSDPRGAADPRAALDRRAPRTVAPAPQRSDAIVAVYGDRFGLALASGLEDGTPNDVAIVPQTTDDAALTRADFNDWLQSIRTRLAKPDHPALAIVMLGSNDRQTLPDNGSPVDVADPRWSGLYGARVDALAGAFRDAHVRLVWVGLPSVHSEEISADFVRLNGIVRDRIARFGGTYVDSWEAFADENGRYSPVGPDIEGQSVKLRKAEGFGFTRAGARKLASFVDGDIKRLQAATPSAPGVADITIETAREFDQALQIDVNAQIRREAGLPPDSGLAGAAPGSGTPSPAPKPAAGPVIALTGPPLAPNGELAGSGARASLEPPAQDLIDTAGQKPGRADDFAWPRTR